MIIGVLGGGQLARMLALAGLPLGFEFVFYDPSANPCAATLGRHLQGEFDDTEKLTALARKADLLTMETENIPAQCVEFLAALKPVRPGVAALTAAQDRLREKEIFRELGIPTALFRPVDSLQSLRQALDDIGLPAVLKTRTLGYDGKGQYVLRTTEDIEAAWQTLNGFSLIVEKMVDYDREISIIAVRGLAGNMMFYPISENVHQKGILRLSRSCPGDPAQKQAEALAAKVLEKLDYVGVLALELFQVGANLVANEIAPRVHNSGHWTIEGAVTSQFENHLRAIAGLPLGRTDLTGHAAMVNFIGSKPDLAQLLALRGVHVHLYGKTERPGRKIGHATLWSRQQASFKAGCRTLLNML